MWSGNNADQQWGMNRMAFMNVPHEQVDWASLAQQWIKMKEAPQTEKEGGEAPMEITKEDSTAPTPRENEWMTAQNPGVAAASWGGAGWGWDQAGAWMQWGGATPAVQDMAASGGYTTGPGYSTVPQEQQPPIAPPAPVYTYNPPVQPPTAPVDTYTRGYWTSNPPTESVKNHHTWESSSSSGSSRKKHNAIPVAQPDPAPELDAAKRRALPAWIREGLEKMEREKQKKAEQERIQKLKKEGGSLDYLPPVSDVGDEFSAVNGNMTEPMKKSKFDSDSEEEEGPPPSKPPADLVPTPRKSRFDQSEAPLTPVLPPKPKFKSKEQILQAVMTDVRKILTQILMEVTTEEIEKAVEETHRQFKKKAPATTLSKTPALASLTGKLGLGIYESDSGSESEPEKVTNEPDSDQELRERIDKLKNEFTRIEEDIEREAAVLEEKERAQLLRSTQLTTVVEDSSPSGVEDQVQPSREGSTASKSEKPTLEKTSSEEARSNNGLEDSNRDSRKHSRSSERKERRSPERKERKRSSERRDRRSSERSKSDKRSDSSRSSTSESSSSSSSEESSSPSPRRSRKHQRHHHRHHHHKRNHKSRYSRSSSRSKSRSRSRSRDRHRRTKRSKQSSSHSSYRKRSDDRKRRHSSSSSSSSSTKYRKTSHRR